MSRRGGTRNAPNPTHGELHRLHEQARLSRARADLARAQAEESALREGLGTFGMPGWADLFDPYSYRRDDFGTSALPYGAGTLAARQGGKNRPFAWTDFDLDLNRSLARHLVTGNSMAKGYVRAIRNFIVKKGFEYEARPAAAYKRDPEAAKLALRVQRVIDRYSDVNRLSRKERDACLVTLRDGDVGVRHFAQPDGTTLDRWMWSEQIRNGPGCPQHSCTMGVEYDPDDIETTLAYWVTYDGTEWIRVPADEASFFKRNVDDCVVRGLGEFVSSGEVFDGVRKLLKNMVTAGAVQAAIAWIEQFADSTLSQVTSHMAGIKDLNRPQLQGPISGRDLNYRKYEAGSIPLVGKGKQYVPPPVPVGSSAHIQIVQAALRSVGTEWNMPEYMVSGDASNNNFASILVSGSPFVNGIEAEQDDYGHFFLRWRWVAIRNACEAGLLAPYTFGQVMEAIDVHFTAPLVAVAKDGEQAEIDHKDIAAGVLSLPTRAARRGLDWEQEQANNAKYPPTRVAGKAQDIDPQGDPVKPGAAEQGQAAPAAGPVRESHDAIPALTDAEVYDWSRQILESSRREEGERWQGPSGRWFTIKSGRAVPAAGPGVQDDSGKGGEAEAGGKPKPRGAAGRTAEQLRTSELELIKAGEPARVNEEDLRADYGRRTAERLAVMLGAGPEAAGPLAGALPGGVVGFYASEYRPGVVVVDVKHPAVQDQQRTFRLDEAGDLVCHNGLFFLKKRHRGGGLGLKVFSDQVREMAAAGAARIETTAGKGGVMNGYYTWPRLGYDADLEEGFAEDAPAMAEALLRKGGVAAGEARVRAGALAGARTVLDLMATEDGRALWKAKGYMAEMTFDLTPGSRSLSVLNEYLKSKGKPPIGVDGKAADTAREARRARAKKARAEAEEAARPKPPPPPDPKEAAALDARAEARARGCGLDPEAMLGGLDGKVKAFQEKWLGRADSVYMAGVAADPLKARRQVLNDALFAALRERHEARMADPELGAVRRDWERRGEAAGYDPARLTDDVRRGWSFVATDPDPAKSVGQAYQAAISNHKMAMGRAAP